MGFRFVQKLMTLNDLDGQYTYAVKHRKPESNLLFVQRLSDVKFTSNLFVLH